jgi:hypothetical protein
MSTSTLRQSEWRVCAVAVDGPGWAWEVVVHCRAIGGGEEPGPWRMVRRVTFEPKMSGQLKSDYWKALIKAAAA